MLSYIKANPQHKAKANSILVTSTNNELKSFRGHYCSLHYVYHSLLLSRICQSSLISSVGLMVLSKYCFHSMNCYHPCLSLINQLSAIGGGGGRGGSPHLKNTSPSLTPLLLFLSYQAVDMLTIQMCPNPRPDLACQNGSSNAQPILPLIYTSASKHTESLNRRLVCPMNDTGYWQLETRRVVAWVQPLHPAMRKHQTTSNRDLDNVN